MTMLHAKLAMYAPLSAHSIPVTVLVAGTSGAHTAAALLLAILLLNKIYYMNDAFHYSIILHV